MIAKARIAVPYAVADYAELKGRGFYYVDKTQFIPELEMYNAPVFLRPRRFGKSLLISTLDYYYDRSKAHRFEELFGDTYIGKHPTPEQGQYMIVRYNFSSMQMGKNMEELEKNFNSFHKGKVEITVAHNRDILGDFEFKSKESATVMLEELIEHVRLNNLPKLYILIDEYDNFTNQLLVSFKDSLYEQLTTKDSFFRNFFKTIKAGIDGGQIRACFCTGVLPATMDDLTSGYNIAEVITLEPTFVEMLGFTHDEAAKYLDYVLRTYDKEGHTYDELWEMLVNNYDGYRFLPDARPLFNSTILTYFFKKFAVNRGMIPEEMIDENLRTDISWLRRLTQTQDKMEELLNALLINDELIYSQPDLRSKFNKQKFFEKTFYPISLYYLGMTTLADKFTMKLPNLTVRSIYMDFYNDQHKIEGDATLYVPAFRQFKQDHQFEGVIDNYFEAYLGQFPAQVFDKLNENFIRCSFFELCSRYLSPWFTFSIEQNHASGRSDFVMTGIRGGDFNNDCRVVEFKYFKASEAAKVEAMTEARAEDVAQVQGYAKDINAQFPYYKMTQYVVYISAGKVCRRWKV